MIRSLQVNVAKPFSIVTAGAALTRGMAVTYDAATNSVSPATASAGFGIVDVSPNYDGINASVTPSDASFEDIKKEALCFYVSYCHGERIATNQITGSLSAGASVVAKDGKFAAGEGGEWIYVGVYSDPDFSDMHILQHV